MSNDIDFHLFLFLSFCLLLVVMSVNSSSYSNSSLPPSPLSSSLNMFSLFQSCLRSTAGILNLTTFTVVSILLLLPLYIYVLYQGLQRWRLQCSNAMMSHSDVITYHMVVAELMCVLGFIVMFSGALTDLPWMAVVGTYFFFFNSSVQVSFHILTCVERYLAVVHPVTYLSLKKEKWVRIRNIIIGCMWLMCIVGTTLFNMDSKFLTILNYCVGSLIFIIVSFCSLSVLCVLIRPGPGEGGGGRQQVDQSKLRAYYTIMAILGVLMFRFMGMLISGLLISSPKLSKKYLCVVCYSSSWYCLPSSLVLPLLFLQRAGKLPCCQKNNG